MVFSSTGVEKYFGEKQNVWKIWENLWKFSEKLNLCLTKYSDYLKMVRTFLIKEVITACKFA